MSSIEAKLRITFKEFRDIFENWDTQYPPIKKANSLLYIPKLFPVHNNPSDGLRLKDGVGFVAIQQEINKKGEPISYNYCFTSSIYQYLLTNNESGITTDVDNFYFRFDKCKNNEPHNPHISVMSPSCIRYISKDIELRDFLLFIKEHFYDGSTKKTNLFDNRP